MVNSCVILTCEIIQGISQVMEKTDVVSVKDLERKLLMKEYIKSEDICYETLRKYVNHPYVSTSYSKLFKNENGG